MLGLSLMTIGAITMLSGAPSQVGYYPEVMAVIDVEEETNDVVCMNFNGDEFGFADDTEDWVEGDVCGLIMCDNGTEDIHDDFIVSAMYRGWTDSWGWDIENHCPLVVFSGNAR